MSNFNTTFGSGTFKETAIASAATTDLGTLTTVRANITGTVSITSFGTKADCIRFLRFSGILTLTYNATSLILPGAANIVTAAGDTATAMSDDSGNWRVVNYQRASGTPNLSPANTNITISPSGTGQVIIDPATAGTLDNMVIGGITPKAATVTAPGAGDSSGRAITSAWFGQNMSGGSLNKFRNGTMDVWQRGTASQTITTSGGYTADGWIVVPTGASVAVAQAAGRLLTANSLLVTGASSVTDAIVKQRIESFIAAALASQTVTVQAWVFNNTGGSITPTLTVKHATAADNWGTTSTDVSAVSLQACANSAWTQVAYTFAANAASGNGLEISFDFGNNFSTSGKSIQLTECNIRPTPGVSTGLNANPPPVELRPIGLELQTARRYFNTTYVNAAPGTASAAGDTTAPTGGQTTIANGVYIGNEVFPSLMRATPSVTVYGVAGTSGTVSNGSGTDLAASSGTTERITARNFAIANVSGGSISTSGGELRYHYTASAEL